MLWSEGEQKREFKKENKKARKQELDQESDPENKKARKQELDESDQEKRKNFIFFLIVFLVESVLCFLSFFFLLS